MDAYLLLEQVLNGIQFGIMLFLIAAGLTLVFGIMNLVNLAHGSLYMLGAYICASVTGASGSFLAGIGAALAGTLAVGVLIELGVFRALYDRPYLDQVLASFGLTLIFNEGVRMVWGPDALFAAVPDRLSGHVEILPGLPFPAYRIAIAAAGLCAAGGLYAVIAHTRLGMLIRAGASNRSMVAALGVNIDLLYTVIFGVGAMLAGFAGAMAAPLLTVESGMGNDVLILSLVAVTIGGIGSIRGAFAAALAIGVVDAVGRSALRPALGLLLSRSAADNAAPALSSMLVYVVMALVLLVRPRGLFPPATR